MGFDYIVFKLEWFPGLCSGFGFEKLHNVAATKNVDGEKYHVETFGEISLQFIFIRDAFRKKRD